MTIDHLTVAELHQQLQQELDKFAAARNLTARVGAATFTGNNVHFKVELAVVGPHGQAMTREAEQFLHHATCHGLSPDHLGKIIMHNGRNYRIAGLSVRSRTTPIIVVDDTGRQFKMSANTIKHLLAIPGAAEQRTAGDGLKP